MRKIFVGIVVLCVFISLSALVQNSNFSVVQNSNAEVKTQITHQVSHVYRIDYFNDSIQYRGVVGNDTLILDNNLSSFLNYIDHFHISNSGKPIDIAINSTGFFFVCDSKNNQLRIYTPSFVNIANRAIYNPVSVAINATDYIYVMANRQYGIQIYSPQLTNVSFFGKYGLDCGFANGWGISINGSGYVYACDKDPHFVKIFTPGGNWIKTFAGFGNGTYFYQNYDVYVNGSGYVYVADSGYKRIKVFTPGGNYLYQFGSLGMGENEFNYPKGITGKNGVLFICDTDNDRLKLYKDNGFFIKMNGSYGGGNNEFEQPQGLIVNDSNFIFVCDSSNFRICIYKYGLDTVLSVGSYISPILNLGEYNNYFVEYINLSYITPSDSSILVSAQFSEDNETWSGWIPLVGLPNVTVGFEAGKFFQFYINFTSSTDYFYSVQVFSLLVQMEETILNEIAIVENIQTVHYILLSYNISCLTLDMDLDLCNLTLRNATDDSVIESWENVENGTICFYNISLSEYGTEYWFYFEITDGENATSTPNFNILTETLLIDEYIELFYIIGIITILFGVIAGVMISDKALVII